MDWWRWDESQYILIDKNKQDKYEVIKKGEEHVHTLEIKNITLNDAGYYKARCGLGGYSNAVNVRIGKASF